MTVLKSRSNPHTWVIGATCLLYCLYYAVVAGQGETPGLAVGYAYLYSLNSAIAYWVVCDRWRRGYSTIFEYDTFVFFGYFFMIPYYCFRSRGWKGVGLLIIFILLYWMPYFCGNSIYHVCKWE